MVVRAGEQYRVVQRPCYASNGVLVVSQDEMLRVFPLSWLFLRLQKFWISARPGNGEVLTHSDPPDNRALVLPSTGKVFAVVAPLNVPHLVSVYFQNCGCGVREA